jgi:glycosyltransferase involved in cell wall biosynthesis
MINPKKRLGFCPKISIITVCYNAEKQLKKTIDSVINQTYKNIEFIIIDGASSDNSLELLKTYSSSINFWVSEPDHGIYDAMNKGLSVATGDYVQFLNAGDYFCDETSLEAIIEQAKTHYRE